jgi:hypothetical protein
MRLAVLCLLVLVAPARADETLTREEQARRHFSLGQMRYAEQRYKDALAEFELGYALSPRPDFLINFAQVYRKLGQHERALTECERYLATSPPPEIADQTRRLMAVIREEQARQSIKPRPTPPPEPVVPPVVQSPPQAPPPTPAKKSRAWIWGVVLGSVAVAGAAVGIGVAVAFPTVTYPSEPLGQVSFR